MFRTRPWAAIALAAGVALAPSASASDTASPGFQLANAPSPNFLAATCTLASGESVTFDGLQVVLWSPTGAFERLLATLPAFTYASFVRETPDHLAVVFAESGDGSGLGGNVYRALLDGSSSITLTALVFPYDAAFLPNGELIVTAATQGFNAGNDFALVGPTPAPAVLIGHVDGNSGPIAVARNGDVYYVTEAAGFSPPPGSSDVLRWTYANVLAHGPLDTTNAITVATGFDGASSIAFSPVKGKLHIAENNYALNEHHIWRVGTSKATSKLIVTSTDFISSLRFANAGGDATFDAYQPDSGERLLYSVSDYFAYDDIVTVTPKRPVLSVAGPGVLGTGNVTLTVDGGVPNGSALLTYCTQSAIAPIESAIQFPKFLHHTPFSLSQTVRFTFLLPSDANGTTNVTFYNPGGLTGLFGYQFLVGNAGGTLIGSSNAVQF